jgi:uncharacterized RDD family membrane protein YckC
MPDLVVETPEGLTLRHELAGAGSRSAAGLIDLTLLGLFMLLAVLFLTALQGAEGLVLWIFTGVLVSLTTYQVAFGIGFGGRTPGKWALGIRVVDEQGFPASPAQHVLRGLFWPLEAVILAVPVPIGIVIIAATPRRQRLGDMVAGTVVLRDKQRSASGEPYSRDTWSGLPRRRLDLVPAHAARFDGADLDFLRELLSRVDMERSARGRLLVQSARHYASRLDLDPGENLSPRQALGLLREIFLFLRELRGRALTPPPGAAAAAARGSAPAPAPSAR